MTGLHRSRRASAPRAVVGACLIALLGTARPVQAADVTVPGGTDFPESMTASADGTLFFSSLAGGRIFRAEPGATQASEWIKQGTNGLSAAIGVLADDKSNTVYACSSDFAWAGVRIPTGDTPTSLKMFDLKTGAPKGSVALPASTLLGQTSFCNDIAVAADFLVMAAQLIEIKSRMLLPRDPLAAGDDEEIEEEDAQSGEEADDKAAGRERQAEEGPESLRVETKLDAMGRDRGRLVNVAAFVR